MNVDQPLVSCICLTHNSIDLLRRSIECFLSQTYANKELIVAFTDDNKSAADLVGRIGNAAIRPLLFSSEKKTSLGEKRNMAIMDAKGDYICNWDDDDWHHMRRLEVQANSLFGTGYDASVLSKIILYDGVTGNSYISATRWGWEQTLFCKTAIFKDEDCQYELLDRGEDSPLVYKLKQRDLLRALPSPYLYVYVYHTQNVFHREHWEVNLLPWAEKLSATRAAVVHSVLQGATCDMDDW